jgi:hypothetical protein
VNSDWHRLVGKGLSDLLAGLPFLVVQEMDLSARRSRLDFALIRIVPGAHPSDLAPKDWRWPDLPDGLTDLSAHNLITYRSPGTSAKLATLWELVGYLVDYLKLEHKGDWNPLRASEASQAEEPAGDETARQSRELFLENQVADGRVRLFCVSTHRPEWLQPDTEGWQQSGLDGIYELTLGRLPVRLIIPREVVRCPRNALWHVLSGDRELVEYGLAHFQAKDWALHSLFRQEVADCYSKEGIRLMAITSEDYRREAREKLMTEATLEERLKGLDAEQRLKGLDPEQRLKGLDPEQRLKGLDPEQRLKGLDPEQRLKGLDPEQRLKGLDPGTALRVLFPNATDEQIQQMLLLQAKGGE